jgi:hypothetical protein
MDDKIYGYIYLITCEVNFMMYIGKHTYNKPEIDKNYLCSTTNDNFYKDYDKYGSDNFSIEIIDLCYDLDDLNQSEKDLIKYYRYKYSRSKLYNIADGGEGGATWVNYRYTDPEKYQAIIDKMSSAISIGLRRYYSIEENRLKHKEGCNTLEAKHNYSLAALNRWNDEEFRDMMLKIRNTDEYRMNMSISITNLWKNKSYYEDQVKSHNTESAKEKSRVAALRGHSDPELAKKYKHPNKKYLFKHPDGTTSIHGKVRTIRKNHPDWICLGLYNNSSTD